MIREIRNSIDNPEEFDKLVSGLSKTDIEEIIELFKNQTFDENRLVLEDQDEKVILLISNKDIFPYMNTKRKKFFLKKDMEPDHYINLEESYACSIWFILIQMRCKCMGYITFLDLLGTKDFCGTPEIYNTNISIFYKEVQTISYRLKGTGKIGIFSDCLYAESEDLKPILDFLISLRKRLCAQKLFFNAALTKGEIGIVILHAQEMKIFSELLLKRAI